MVLCEMRHDALFEQNCAIARTGGILGERWVIAILRAAFFRARTFEDYQRMTGVARNILTQRLGHLVDFGILERRAYAEGEKRTLYEYRLTDAGLDLYPVIVSLMEWGNKHSGLLHGPPVELVHKCGARTMPVLVCPDCGERIDARDIEAVAGPGAEKPSPPVRPIAAD